MAKFSYFYVLYCNDHTLYGGYTTDLERRLEEHNSGAGAKYTRPKVRRPVQMIYAEKFDTRSEATKAEYAFKQKTRAAKERYLKARGVSNPHIQSPALVIIDKTKGEMSENEESKEF